MNDYYVAAVIIGISGITDFLDGFVSRKFHIITEVGKALDPIADKLTQGAILLALSLRYHHMIVLIRKGKMLDGARWFGKVCTTVLYAVMFVLIMFPQIPMPAVNGLIILCGLLMLNSFICYIFVFRKMDRRGGWLAVGVHSR